MVVDHNFFMALAIKEAWRYQGLTYPNPAVGAVVVGAFGEILAIEAHKRAGMPHAEVNALQVAYVKLTKNDEILKLKSSQDIHNFLLKNHNGIFKNTSIYTTLEPCSHIGKTPSCASLISSLGIKKVYIGVADLNDEASNGADILKQNGCEVEFNILQKEASDLLYPFKKTLKSSFVVFKWAKRMDGSFDGGTISSYSSRLRVHQMRDRCDLLVIGGKTVRVDRPTLDARLVDGKAPDVLILSKQDKFDKSIPLFGIKNRKVFIENNLDRIKEYKNIMIEGGANMFELTKDITDYYLCFEAPSFGGSARFENLDEKFEILNLDKESQDIIMWLKRI